MKARVLVLITAAVVALLGVGVLALYVQGANSRAVAGARPTQVYVTQAVIPAGTTLEDAVAEKLVVRTNLPAGATPVGVLTAVSSSNRGLVAVNDIQAGEYVLSARFATESAGVQAIVVPKGLVAVSAELPDPARVGTFLTPGSHIVVYDTHEVPAKDDAQAQKETRVLLENALVIAVGDTSLTPVQDGAAKAASTSSSVLVTLALSPADSARLVHGIQTGQLYAALQGSTTAVTEGSGVDDDSLFAG